ncbi:MAG: hypothetical protein ACX98W_01470 [bacterium]
MNRAELNSNPIEGEFFTPQGVADALVRETIQNSLDAKLPGSREPVHVHFKYSRRVRQLSPADAAPYLSGIAPHLRALSNLVEVPATASGMPFLTIEDFGTRGLSGSPEQADDDDAGATKNNFYYFWRNIGRSAKEEHDRGRWGLGKTVFPACSGINSFFGLTRRHDDQKALLMGQSVLQVHKVDGERCSPYGYFADFEPTGGFARPIEDSGLIDRFCVDFGLHRGSSPGLSIVIPYPDPELKHMDLVRSAIVQYFHPIISGGLAVTFDLEGEEIALNSRTIDDVTDRVMSDSPRHQRERDALHNLYEMARWAQGLANEDRLVLEPAGRSGAPRWDESLFPANQLADIQRRFEQGEPIAIRARVHVKRKSEAPISSEWDLYIQRDETLDGCEEHYVRQGITIPGIRLLRDRGVRGLVVVENDILSSLLGDSENPAHTDWLERRPIIKKRYERGASTIRFVRGSLREIVQLISRPPEGRDENLLQEVFFIDCDWGEGTAPAGGSTSRKRKRRRMPKPPIPPSPKQQPFRMESESGGFHLVGNPEATAQAQRIVIRAAYGVRKGDPFKSYNVLDFRLDREPIRMELDGAGIEALDENRMVLKIQRLDFRVSVGGFDRHRDLVVNARRLEAST